MYSSGDSSIRKKGYQGNACVATGKTVGILHDIITSEQILLILVIESAFYSSKVFN